MNPPPQEPRVVSWVDRTQDNLKAAEDTGRATSPGARGLVPGHVLQEQNRRRMRGGQPKVPIPKTMAVRQCRFRRHYSALSNPQTQPMMVLNPKVKPFLY